MSKQPIGFAEQIISNGTEQQFKRKVRALTKRKSKQREDIKWEWYMNFIKFYGHIIVFEGEDEDVKTLNRMRPFFAKEAFWNGQFAVKKEDKKIGIYQVINPKRGIDGFVKESEVVNVFNQNDNNIIKAGVNGAFYQTSIYSFPWLIGLDAFLDPILDVWDLLLPEIKNSITKLLLFIPQEMEGSDFAIEELSRLADTNGLIKVYKGKPIQTEKINTVSINDKLWEHIKSMINLMFQLRGRKTNISEKQAGVGEYEVNTNAEQFEVVIDEMLDFWNEFINQYNESYGTNIEVKRATWNEEVSESESDNESPSDVRSEKKRREKRQEEKKNED